MSRLLSDLGVYDSLHSSPSICNVFNNTASVSNVNTLNLFVFFDSLVSPQVPKVFNCSGQKPSLSFY